MQCWQVRWGGGERGGKGPIPVARPDVFQPIRDTFPFPLTPHSTHRVRSLRLRLVKSRLVSLPSEIPGAGLWCLLLPTPRATLAWCVWGRYCWCCCNAKDWSGVKWTGLGLILALVLVILSLLLLIHHDFRNGWVMNEIHRLCRSWW